jgi:hypothetical protein
MSVIESDTEIETYTCSGLCGATVEVSISDDSDLLPSEQRSGQLDSAGWIVTSESVTCPDCVPTYSHLEEVDQRVDWERESDRL